MSSELVGAEGCAPHARGSHAAARRAGAPDAEPIRTFASVGDVLGAAHTAALLLGLQLAAARRAVEQSEQQTA